VAISVARLTRCCTKPELNCDPVQPFTTISAGVAPRLCTCTASERRETTALTTESRYVMDSVMRNRPHRLAKVVVTRKVSVDATKSPTPNVNRMNPT
jgi:hypothetical protein